MSTLIRNARVLTLDPSDREYERADILIEGDAIAAIGPDLVKQPVPGQKVIEAAGLLAMPGLVNGHLHGSSNFYKGAFDPMPLEVSMPFEGTPLTTDNGGARFYYLRTLLGCVEMLKLGVTAVHDDHYHLPWPTTASIDAVMQAYVDGGMRATVTLDQHNVPESEKTPFLAELLPEALRRRIDGVPLITGQAMADMYADTIRRWHGAAEGRIGVAVSCSALQRVTPEYMATLSALSRKHDLAFDIHLLETKVQRVLGEERYGRSLVRQLEKLGILDERVLAIHCVWTDEEDIATLARAGCTVAHNTVSNLRIGSGVMPFRLIRDHGVPFCLGTDEACLNDSASVWNVMQVAGLIHTLTETDDRHWPRALELLRAATSGGARGMRPPRPFGTLAPGQAADLILIDLDSLPFTPLNNLRRQLVFCENGSSIVMVMVAGREVVREGKLLTLDESEMRREVRALLPEHRRTMAEAKAAATELEPYYREVYKRSMARDVGMNRRALPVSSKP
jgi:5-methylthioadenosine/S-adenosylhomocysteine deaminase